MSSNKEKAHCHYVFKKTGVLCCITLQENKMYHVTKVRCGLKTKIVMFAGQHITEFNPV